MGMSKWFKQGYEAVEDYSEELEAKRENAKNFTPFVPNLMLRDGESKVIRFITQEPLTFKEHYLPTAKGSKFRTCLEGTVDLDGNRVQCPFCSAGNKPSFRGAFVVIDRTEDSWVNKDGETVKATNQVKIFKQGIKVLKVLNKMHEKGRLDGWDIEISRTGGGTDTQYNFIPEEQFELSAEDAEKVALFQGDKILIERLAEEIEPLDVEGALTVLRGGIPIKKNTVENPEPQTQKNYDDNDSIGF